MNSLRKTAIIFDLGGVLAHVNWDKPFSLFQRACRRPLGDSGQIFEGSLVRSFMRGSLSPEDFHHSFCDNFDLDLNLDEFISIWNSPFQPNHDIFPVIQKLEEGHLLAVGSNTDPLHFSYLHHHVETLQRFDNFFLSYEIGVLKPDPRFFHTILDELDISPEECVFIDDRNDNVKSARNLGFTALHFQSVDVLKGNLADLGLM